MIDTWHTSARKTKEYRKRVKCVREFKVGKMSYFGGWRQKWLLHVFASFCYNLQELSVSQSCENVTDCMLLTVFISVSISTAGKCVYQLTGAVTSQKAWILQRQHETSFSTLIHNKYDKVVAENPGNNFLLTSFFMLVFHGNADRVEIFLFSTLVPSDVFTPGSSTDEKLCTLCTLSGLKKSSSRLLQSGS